MIDWGFSIAVVITGLVVVFVVLLLLVLMCTVMGKVFSSIDKKKKDAEQMKNEIVSAPKTTVVSEVKAVSESDNDGVIAAITAAISAIWAGEGNKKPFAIKSIKRAKEQRPVWGAAGIIDNTRQF